MLQDTDFIDTKFNPDHFVSEKRKEFTLEALESELRSYISGLDEALVNIINHDYAQFLKLSTMLVNIDAMVASLKCPLDVVESRVNKIGGTIGIPLGKQEDLLAKFNKNRMKKKLLESQLTSWDILEKVETDISKLAEDGSDDQYESVSRASQRLARISYLAQNSSHLPLFRVIKAKSRTLEHKLLEVLSKLFVDAFQKSDKTALIRIIRAYIGLDQAPICEEVFKTKIAAPYINEMMTVGRLDAGGVRGKASGISSLYDDLAKFPERECEALFDAVNSTEEGFSTIDFMGSYAEAIFDHINSKLPDIYSSGSPDTLMLTYRSTRKFFLSDVSTTSERFRNIGKQLLGLWNLAVYGQLRSEETSSEFMHALKKPVIIPTAEGMMLTQTQILIETFRNCWDDAVFMVPVGSSILRLSFMLVQMYLGWAMQGLLRMNPDFSQTLQCDTESEDLQDTAVESWKDVPVQACLFLYKDCQVIVELLRGEWYDIVIEKLEIPSTMTNTIRDAMGKLLSDKLTYTGDQAKACFEHYILQQCVQAVDRVSEVAPMYRMTNKPFPTTCSPYVASVLTPLEVIPKDNSNIGILQSISDGVLNAFRNKSNEILVEVRNSEKALMRLKRGAAVGRDLDSEKILQQLYLDLDAIKDQCQSLGFDNTSRIEEIKQALTSS